MEKTRSKTKIKTVNLLQFLVWTLLFGLAYAQSPLFTSNQNQYFFFGMARANFPLLQNDWLYSTTDIAPLFSALVSFSQRLFQTNFAFYIEYFIIFGVYLFSTFSICSNVFEKLTQKTEKLIFAFLMILLHSAALRYLFASVLSPDWEFLIEGGVAGQRLLGDVFQPSTFGVFLLLGMALFLKEKIVPAILATTLAALVHPTYLLSAAILTFSYMLIRWRQTHSFRQPLMIGMLALFLVAPIVVYVAANFLGGDPAINAAGQQIVLEYRQPHHMLIANWLDLRVAIKLLLFLTSLWIVRKHTLFTLLLIPGVFVIGLTLIQAVIQSPSLAMLFPWRFSVVLVPLSSAIIAGFLVDRFTQSQQDFIKRKQPLQTIALIGMVFLALIGLVKFLQLTQIRRQSPETALYQHTRTILAEHQMYMIPLKLQNFRLETGAPVVVEYKAAPQSSEGVLEWYQRVQEVDHFYSGLPWDEACSRLPELIQRYDITHIVIPLEGFTDQSCLQEIFRNEAYAIFKPIVKRQSN